MDSPRRLLETDQMDVFCSCSRYALKSLFAFEERPVHAGLFFYPSDRPPLPCRDSKGEREKLEGSHFAQHIHSKESFKFAGRNNQT